ncbi:MAG: hypothetical protein IT334_08210 [Thermomicrobiales bacterium]|nr:hypothetical protein [Thermomicrobiales bacterium]
MREQHSERPLETLPDEPETDDAIMTEPALLRPAHGLTMITGDPAGVCEGDACVVPWMRNEDAD